MPKTSRPTKPLVRKTNPRPVARPGIKPSSKYIAIDTETTGLKVVHGINKPFAVFTCDDLGVEHQFIWSVNPETQRPNVNDADLVTLRDLIGDRIPVFHNAKFDIEALNATPDFRWGKHVSERTAITPAYPNPCHCTQILSHVFHSSEPHGLKQLAPRYISEFKDMPKAKKHLHDLVVKARRVAKSHGIPYPEEVETSYWLPAHLANDPDVTLDPDTRAKFQTGLAEYGRLDARATISLFLMYRHLLSTKEYECLLHNYEREISLLPSTLSLEYLGVSIIYKELIPLLADFRETVTVTTMKMQRMLRLPNFNPNSPTQVTEAFKAHGLVLKTTEADYLEDFREHPNRRIRELIDLLLTNKKAASGVKALTQYQTHAIGPTSDVSQQLYPYQLDEVYRIHATYKPNGPATTRYSCSDPNVQNVAGKDGSDPEESLPLRKAFGPSRDKANPRVWYSFDYKQLQLRIFAHEANDQEILDRLKNGEDFHEIVARRLFDIPDGTPVPEKQRRDAKTINFGLIFGMGREKLAARTGRADLYDMFRQQFPSLDGVMAEAQAQVRRYGYVTTRFGYRLYPRGGAAHKALNFIVQGGEGDIMKNSMIRVHSFLEDLAASYPPPSNTSKPAFITLTVHDELVIDAPDPWSLKHVITVKDLMEQAGSELGFDTPVSASIIATNWSMPEKLTLSRIL